MINFISGLIIGGLIGMVLMCLLQINRDNKAQRRINKAIDKVNDIYFEIKYSDGVMFVRLREIGQGKELLEILGGKNE